MAICELCKKKTVVGRRSKHKRGVASAKFSNKAKKVSRFFRPNLQRVTRELDGHKVSGLFCTACIRKMKQSEKIREEETKEREKKKNISKIKIVIRPVLVRNILIILSLLLELSVLTFQI